MGFVVLYIALCIIVGVAANTRGRSPAGWFLLAIVLSPLISGLLVLALPNQRDALASLVNDIRDFEESAERILIQVRALAERHGIVLPRETRLS